MEKENLNLTQKLARIRVIADVVSKDKRGFNYTYADITEILAKITAGMKKYEVSLIPQIVPGTAHVEQTVSVNTKTDKTGRVYDNTTTEMLATADMIFRWVNNDNPADFIDVPWFVAGAQPDPSQALGAGLTYCTRYFLINFFQIATTDNDVDAYRSKQKAAEESEERAIAKEIIGQFDILLRDYLSRNAHKTDEVKSFLSRYVKGGNYLTIKEPKLAAKLMEEFKNVYLKEKE